MYWSCGPTASNAMSPPPIFGKGGCPIYKTQYITFKSPDYDPMDGIDPVNGVDIGTPDGRPAVRLVAVTVGTT